MTEAVQQSEIADVEQHEMPAPREPEESFEYEPTIMRGLE
jgi:hypothetical protein